MPPPRSADALERPTGNLVLDRLLELEPGLAPHTEALEVPAGTRLVQPGEDLKHLLFPSTCVASVLIRLSDGRASEVTTVGNEGFVGVLVCLGVQRAPYEVLQQVPGTLYRTAAQPMVSALERNGGARALVNCYIAYALGFAHQSAACNAQHSADQRTSRWLLHTSDRMRGARLHLSHTTLAEMLGLRRQSVSEVLDRLQRSGVLATGYRAIELLDRDKLEARACECYGAMRGYYRELLGELPGGDEESECGR